MVNVVPEGVTSESPTAVMLFHVGAVPLPLPTLPQKAKPHFDPGNDAAVVTVTEGVCENETFPLAPG